MSKKVTTSSPKLFIGIDIHKKSWKVHFCTDISEGSTSTFAPTASKLRKYVSKYYSKHEVTVAYEAGCCGFEHARQFIGFSWATLVVNAADIPRPAKQSIVKTDKIDAKNIAKQLRAGLLKSITIPDTDRECLRSLTRQRTCLLKDLKRTKTRIKSLLLYYNVHVPEEFDNASWTRAFRQWLKDIEWNYVNIDSTLKSLLKQLDFLDEMVRDTANQMRAYCKKYLKHDYLLLRSVPGIAGLTASYILAEVGDLRRFHSFKKFAGYIGILPGIYSSGENESVRGVTPRANYVVRSLIVEASWVAIRKDPVMQEYYRKHAGKNSKAAIFKVSRKLLSRVHAVIKTDTPYQLGLVS